MLDDETTDRSMEMSTFFENRGDEDSSHWEMDLAVRLNNKEGTPAPRKAQLRCDKRNDQHQEEHVNTGSFLKSIVYGGLDGSISTIIIVLSGISSQTSARQIMTISVAALFANAISMGFGDYLSSKAEIGFIQKEKAKELQAIDTDIQQKKREIVKLYLSEAESVRYSMDETERLVDLFALNREAFVDIIMLEKHHLVQVQSVVAVKCGIATFFSFLIFGCIPIIPYIVSVGFRNSIKQQQIPVILLGVVELYSLGHAKAKLIGLNTFKSGMETLFFGIVVSAIGYGLGLAFQI